MGNDKEQRAEEPLEKDSKRVEKIRAIDVALDRIKDLDLLLEKVLQMARDETAADAGTIYIREGEQLLFRHTQNETFQARLNPGEKLVYSHFFVPINDLSIAGFVANNRKVLNIPNMYGISKEAPYHFDPSFDERTGYKTVSSLSFPLLSHEGDLLGVLQLINSRDKEGVSIPFRQEDESFLEVFSRFASKAMQRAQMTRNLLETITRFAGLRDPKETWTHANRVGSYTMEIYEAWANRRCITKEKKESNKDILRMAAMLHDVGKVGISDVILKKPGVFTNEERRVMESHTWLGARQFLDKSDLSVTAQAVALRHHENWDGTGYPGKIENLYDADKMVENNAPRPPGLVGQEIPLNARIVAIADVYDALCASRVYKDSWPEKKVVREMKKMSGTKFDPELVEIFQNILPTLRSIRERLPDVD